MHKAPQIKSQSQSDSLIPPDQRETLLSILYGVEERLTLAIETSQQITDEKFGLYESRLLQVEKAILEYRYMVLELQQLSQDVKAILSQFNNSVSRDIDYEMRLIKIEQGSVRNGRMWGIGAGAGTSGIVGIIIWLIQHLAIK